MNYELPLFPPFSSFMSFPILRQANCYCLFPVCYLSSSGRESLPLKFPKCFACFMAHYTVLLRLGATGVVTLGPLLAAGALAAALVAPAPGLTALACLVAAAGLALLVADGNPALLFALSAGV